MIETTSTKKHLYSCIASTLLQLELKHSFSYLPFSVFSYSPVRQMTYWILIRSTSKEHGENVDEIPKPRERSLANDEPLSTKSSLQQPTTNNQQLTITTLPCHPSAPVSCVGFFPEGCSHPHPMTPRKSPHLTTLKLVAVSIKKPKCCAIPTRNSS